MQKPTSILFIGHDANRAGGQYLLLHVLTYLRENGTQTGLVLGEDGPLIADYERVTTVYRAFSPAPPQPASPTLITRLLAKFGFVPKASIQQPETKLPDTLLQRIRAENYGCVVSNTIANGRLLRLLEPLGLPFVLYVHELETAIQIHTDPNDLAYELEKTSHVFCGSEAVRQNLIRRYHLTTDETSVLNSMIQTKTVLEKLTAVNQHEVRQQLGIPVDALIVGGCGNAEWRKGIDLFLLVAQHVLKTHPDIHFVWVGVPDTGEEARRLTYDLNRMAMANRVHLIPPSGTYLSYVACFDVFTLTSREDPYPLVILEAGLNHNPVLCFDDSGGSPDFVGTDTGCLIPYLDLPAMAQAIINLSDTPAERARLGQLYYERAMAHDVAVLVPKLLANLDHLFFQPTTT